MGKVIGALAARHSTDANATAAQILLGKKAVVNNTLVTGTYKRIMWDPAVGGGVVTISSTDYMSGYLSFSTPETGVYNVVWCSAAYVYDGSSAVFINDVMIAGSERLTSANAMGYNELNNISLNAGDIVNIRFKANTEGGSISTCLAVMAQVS